MRFYSSTGIRAQAVRAQQLTQSAARSFAFLFLIFPVCLFMSLSFSLSIFLHSWSSFITTNTPSSQALLFALV
jgi:hypothetical protein